jgi:hypothetical protein
MNVVVQYLEWNGELAIDTGSEGKVVRVPLDSRAAIDGPHVIGVVNAKPRTVYTSRERDGEIKTSPLQQAKTRIGWSTYFDERKFRVVV